MSSTITINAPFIIDRDELWSRVWGAEPQTAGDHYRRIKYLEGKWDEAGRVEVTLENPGGQPEGDDVPTIKRIITVEGIALALSDPAYPDHLRQEILNDDADCFSADAVVQWIAFGEIVYG